MFIVLVSYCFYISAWSPVRCVYSRVPILTSSLTYTAFRCSDSDTDTIFFQRRLIPNSTVYLAAVSNPCRQKTGYPRDLGSAYPAGFSNRYLTIINDILMDFHIIGLASSLALRFSHYILLHSITSPTGHNTDSLTNMTTEWRSTSAQRCSKARTKSDPQVQQLHVTSVTPLNELAFLSRPVGHKRMLNHSPLWANQMEQLLVGIVDHITLVSGGELVWHNHSLVGAKHHYFKSKEIGRFDIENFILQIRAKYIQKVLSSDTAHPSIFYE